MKTQIYIKGQVLFWQLCRERPSGPVLVVEGDHLLKEEVIIGRPGQHLVGNK